MKFTNIVIEDGDGRGFHVNGNVDVEVDGMKISRVKGDAVYLESAGTAPALDLINQIRQELAKDILLHPQAAFVNAELEKITTAISSPSATKGGVKKMFSTIKDKLLENGGILAGHAIIHLIDKAHPIIDGITHLAQNL
ncbi:MAG: hypothetical protein ACRYFV_20600 [Janthinobacterium lividum]